MGKRRKSSELSVFVLVNINFLKAENHSLFLYEFTYNIGYFKELSTYDQYTVHNNITLKDNF